MTHVRECGPQLVKGVEVRLNATHVRSELRGNDKVNLLAPHPSHSLMTAD